jgi:hypothetical protein
MRRGVVDFSQRRRVLTSVGGVVLLTSAGDVVV